jgi:hypothetical protein
MRVGREASEDDPLAFFVRDVPLRVLVTGPLFQYVGIRSGYIVGRTDF